MLTYPRADSLDDPDLLVGLLGSFWADSFADRDFVRSWAGALGLVEQEAQGAFDELLAAMARRSVPLYHQRQWYPLTLLQSAMVASGGTYVWTLPAGLVSVPALVNRITDSSLTLIEGIDYTIADGQISLRLDPFLSEDVYQEDIIKAGVVADRLAQLWIYQAGFDEDTVYRQYGYALRLAGSTSPAYKQLVNALYDNAVQGTTRSRFDQALAAITGNPLALGQETVEDIFRDDQSLRVLTDKNAYPFAAAALPLVQRGQQVHGGQALTDALQVFELNNGIIPAGLDALTIGTDILEAGFTGGLTFRNTLVPWVLSTDTEGHTVMEFTIEGAPADVALFWSRVHAKGLTYHLTLAHLLDSRSHPQLNPDLESFSDLVSLSESEPPPYLEPGPAALPTQVNPLQFLLQNILRNNVVLVLIKESALTTEALGLAYLDSLRQIMPPQTLLLTVLT